MSFADWVQENWPVKLDIVKGDFGGDPNVDSRISNYAVYPALLLDEFDNKFYLRNPNEWVQIGQKDDDGGSGSLSLESLEAGSGLRITESFGNEGEIKRVRIDTEGTVSSSPDDGDQGTLSEKIETKEGLYSFPRTKATEQEADSLWISDKGKVSSSEGDGHKDFLDEKIETSGLNKFPRTKATEKEVDTLWLSEEGNVKASSSDKGAADLYQKIQTGRGLTTYRQKTGQSDEDESLEIALDDEVSGIINRLKYREYVGTTEQHRSNDIYVDSKTEPYISLRDGSRNRPYLSIKEAVESEQAQRGNCTIWVASGLYIEEAPIKLPPATSVIGSELRRCRIYPSTDTCGASYDRNGGGTYLFEVTHDCIVRNFTIRGIIASGFTFGFIEDADLKTISPYIQNVTSYNDGRDVHQLFDKTLTKVQSKVLPSRTNIQNGLKVIRRDASDPDYNPSENPQPYVVEVDGEIEKSIRLTFGSIYTFQFDNSNDYAGTKILRFTQDIETQEKVSFSDESSNPQSLDLRNLSSEDREKPLYYVLYPDATSVDSSQVSWGKVELYQPNQFLDDYTIRSGDKVSSIPVDPLPLNLERGDAVYLGDPGSVPFTSLQQSIVEDEEYEYTQLTVRPIQRDLVAGSRLYIWNGKSTLAIKLSSEARVGDTQIDIEPVKSKNSFTSESTLHYQHPRWTERYVLTEDAPKGTTELFVGTFSTIAESRTLAYELTNTKEVDPFDRIPILDSDGFTQTFAEGEELWLLETKNDRPTTNHFPVTVKEANQLGDQSIRITDAYAVDSPRDLLKVQLLKPLSGQDPTEEQKPISSSYIRPKSTVVKDPLQRRNAGGGAHVDGFRLADKTRLSFDPPISRLMQFNDFTQVNVNGYGILAEGIANAECVSVFTYFCNNGLYSRNGGEIRALNCSSGFGVYGVKAEGYLGQYQDKSDPNTPEITAQKIWIGYTYNQSLADSNDFPTQVSGDLLNSVGVIEDPNYNPTQEETTAEPKVGSLIRVDNNNTVAGIVSVDRFVRADGKVFVKILIGGTWNAIGADTPSTIEPLGDLNDPLNRKGIYEFRSVVRMTGHDFGYIGTGTRLPRNVGGSGVPITENETKTLDFGQVFWSASDQLGNFTVGEFFRVDQSTGKVSFNTDQFDLTGISELGPFRDSLDNSVGVKIREVSADPELASERDGKDVNPGPNTVPTQTAVKTYVDQRVGAVIDVKVRYIDSNTVILEGGEFSFGSIQLLRGITYRFEIVPDQGVTPNPFNIVYESNNLVPLSEGVVNNGSVSGNVLYTVPFDAPPTLYYRIGEQTIINPDGGQSSLYVRNPDIRLPGGSAGAVQYYGVNDNGEPYFRGNDNITVIGNKITGIFEGTFAGDGRFLENIEVRQSLQDIEGVDLGDNQTQEGDTLAYFEGGTEDDPEWRLARPYIQVILGDGTSTQLPVLYNYKEGTPPQPFTPGKLDFSAIQGSHLIGAI